MKKFWQKEKREILFIGCFLLIGIGILIVTYGQKQEQNCVILQADGTVRKTFSLKDTVTYEIKSEQGSNLLRIEGGSVWLEEADCPDGICVNTGKIKYAGQSIICLPHKVVVEIKENK